jgi:hypothetical protein
MTAVENPKTAQGGEAPSASPWALLKSQHANLVRSVTVVMRADLLDQIDQLEQELVEVRGEDERNNRVALAPHIAEQIRELEDAAKASEVRFSFQGLGRGAFAKLHAEHPVSDADKAEFGDAADFNPRTFPPALMAASCIEPAELRGNLAEWTQIHDEWSEGQVMRIWATCMAANAGVAAPPKSAIASEVLRQQPSGTS